MKLLPNAINLKIENKDSDITLRINENFIVSYKTSNTVDLDTLSDLLECKAYATALLYLNENATINLTDKTSLNKSNIKSFYEDCEELLSTNIEIVEEVGIPLCDINGYKIFEGAGYILRGNGIKKIKESFDDLDLFPAIKKMVLEKINNGENKNDIEDFINGQVSAYSIDKEEAKELKSLIPNKVNEEEGTQTTDIAPKVDQELGKKKEKKKYYDILLSNITEGVEILNKGFLKNSNGQYQRGNYILVKEGDSYLAIHKDKIR